MKCVHGVEWYCEPCFFEYLYKRILLMLQYGCGKLKIQQFIDKKQKIRLEKQKTVQGEV